MVEREDEFAPHPGAEPLPEEYGRVTNPERFAPLHDVVDRVADRLCRELEVDRDDDPVLPPGWSGAVIRAVRLVPTNRGAPVTLACTSFPGVLVAFGDAHTWPYPACGCDACSEDSQDLAAELEADVLAVVRGHFTEYRNRKGEVGYRIEYVNDERRGNGHKAGMPSGNLSEHHWPEWPAR